MKLANSPLTPDAQRWKTAHQLFFTAIQGLLVAIDAYEKSPSAEAVEDVTDILLGSVVIMQFAADFVDEDYTWIRNDMASVREDFSGVFSADHAVMLKKFRVMRDASTAYPEAHNRLSAALTVVYQAHAYVCDKFVEGEGSLANPEVSAPDLLRTDFLRKALVTVGARDRAKNLKKAR